MTASKDQYFRDLLKLRGYNAWLQSLERANAGVKLYGWSILALGIVSVLLRLVGPNGDGFGPVIWVIAGSVTLYVASTQVEILPWLRTSVMAHWFISAIFAVLGCFGLVLYLMMLGHISKVRQLITSTQLSIYGDESSVTSIETSVNQLESRVENNGEFSNWIALLDSTLEVIGSKMDSTKYDIGELRYAFIHDIHPTKFLSMYPRKRLSQPEFESVMIERGSKEAEKSDNNESGSLESAATPDLPKNSLTKADNIETDEGNISYSNAARLRELKILLDRGLITIDQYVAKQEEILREI